MTSLGEAAGNAPAPEYMTGEQLADQCERLVGGVVCYRAYESSDTTRSWTRFAGKLTKENGRFVIEVGPEYNYLPQVQQQTESRKFDMPSRGWTYTRIVRASVWATEFAQQQQQQIQQLQAQLQAKNAPQSDPLNALLTEIDAEGVRPGVGGRATTIETDAYTFNPATWSHDEHGAMRVVGYLRAKFSAELGHSGQKHYVMDALGTIQELAMLVPLVAGLSSNAHFVQAVKIQLKRLLISQMVVRGHNTQYISTFAQAIDTAQMPAQWGPMRPFRLRTKTPTPLTTHPQTQWPQPHNSSATTGHQMTDTAEHDDNPAHEHTQ